MLQPYPQADPAKINENALGRILALKDMSLPAAR